MATNEFSGEGTNRGRFGVRRVPWLAIVLTFVAAELLVIGGFVTAEFFRTMDSSAPAVIQAFPASMAGAQRPEGVSPETLAAAAQAMADPALLADVANRLTRAQLDQLRKSPWPWGSPSNEAPTELLRRHLRVDVSAANSTMQVSFHSFDPDLAPSVANKFADAFLGRAQNETAERTAFGSGVTAATQYRILQTAAQSEAPQFEADYPRAVGWGLLVGLLVALPAALTVSLRGGRRPPGQG